MIAARVGPRTRYPPVDDCHLLSRLHAVPAARALPGEVAHENPDYHCKPVAPFGEPQPALLIVGLAPGMHGANRTGRPFTGDYAGILLYESLHASDWPMPPTRWTAMTG